MISGVPLFSVKHPPLIESNGGCSNNRHLSFRYHFFFPPEMVTRDTLSSCSTAMTTSHQTTSLPQSPRCAMGFQSTVATRILRGSRTVGSIPVAALFTAAQSSPTVLPLNFSYLTENQHTKWNMIRFPMFKFCKWIFFLAKRWWCQNNRLPWKYTQLHQVAHLQSPSGHISHLPWTRGCKAAQDTRLEAGKSRWWFSPPIWNVLYRQLGSFPPILGGDFFKKNSWKHLEMLLNSFHFILFLPSNDQLWILQGCQPCHQRAQKMVSMVLAPYNNSVVLFPDLEHYNKQQ